MPASIMAASRGNPQTAALRQDADAISRTFAQCEQTCLDVGSRLGDAIPGLNDLAGLFETLSQSLGIMAGMARDGHLDPVLFELFLESGIYRRYAEAFLQPGQVDAVDIGRYRASSLVKEAAR